MVAVAVLFPLSGSVLGTFRTWRNVRVSLAMAAVVAVAVAWLAMPFPFAFMRPQEATG